MSKALSKIGVSVGTDGKLSVDEDKLKEADVSSMFNVSAFGTNKEGIGTINKIGVVSDDNGNMKFFAELEKTSDKQKERLEKAL